MPAVAVPSPPPHRTNRFAPARTLARFDLYRLSRRCPRKCPILFLPLWPRSLNFTPLPFERVRPFLESPRYGPSVLGGPRENAPFAPPGNTFPTVVPTSEIRSVFKGFAAVFPQPFEYPVTFLRSEPFAPQCRLFAQTRCRTCGLIFPVHFRFFDIRLLT